VFLQQAEKFAAAAPDIKHVAGPGKERHEHALFLADLVDRSAESILEAGVHAVAHQWK